MLAVFGSRDPDIRQKIEDENLEHTESKNRDIKSLFEFH